MWGFFSDCFYIHSAFCRIHDHIAAWSTVKQYRHIKLIRFCGARIIHIFSHQDLVYGFPFRRGLWGNKLHPKNLIWNRLHFIQRFSEFYTATFASASSVHLGLDDVPSSSRLFGKCFGSCYCLIRSWSHITTLDFNAKLVENIFALVFV